MYIVTGGAGFIGSAMLWKLNNAGVNDILVVDNLGRTEKWKNLVKRDFHGYLQRDEFMDLIERDALEKVSGPKLTAIIHLGACSSTTETDADFLMRNNLAYSQKLCAYALHKCRFINASSAATYGDGSLGFDDNPKKLKDLRPLNMYGYSKHLFDLWAARQGILDDIVSLKFFNVYGPNEEHKGEMRSMVHKAFQQIKASGKIRLFRSNSPAYPDGGQKRDFIYVKDCVDIIWGLLQKPKLNGIFNVGAGLARSWNDLAAAVFKAMGLPVNIEYVDMPAELAGKYQNYTEADSKNLRAAGLMEHMHSLEDGVTDYVRNYLAGPDPRL
ncbi:MAG: ADP-glyceromanno-heptose 6-epimerase [Desulfovibrio sp.]|jgi:ADP-L-glycero-D-manno-heptose 6-epimerase|nr:ADP-glyceromanno-heptose 6-epimerase [Desulfovibrio sp.]